MSALDAIPFVGPIASTIGAVVSGITELGTAKEQKEQAANERKQAMALRAAPIQKEFEQKLDMDKFLALGGMPGLDVAKDQLGQNLADNIRAITQTSNSGATTVNAISSNLAKNYQAMNQLAAQNAQYEAGQDAQVGADLSEVGVRKRELEIEKNTERDKMLESAAALEASSVANKQDAINTITGAAGKGVTNITGNVATQQKDADWSNIWAQWAKTNGLNPNGTSSAPVNFSGPGIGNNIPTQLFASTF